MISLPVQSFRILSGANLGCRGIQSMEGPLQVTTDLSLVTGGLFGTNHVEQESLEHCQNWKPETGHKME